MIGFRSTLIAAAVVTGAITLAACGGGSDNKGKTPASGATQAAGQSGATSAPAKTTAAATSASGSGGGGSDALKAIGRKFAASTFKGTYNLTTSGARPLTVDGTPAATAESDGIQSGKMVLYKDGDKRFRFELTAKQDGNDVHVVYIENGAATYLCFDDAGALGALIGIEPGKGICVNSNSSGANPASSIGSVFSDIETADVTLLETSKRTIAGHDTDCYRSKDNKTGQTDLTCFSSDGALLYSKTEGDNASEMEATEVSGSVKSADFDPPYEVKDVPGLGGSTP
jgi:hypothetical protein